MQSLDVLLLLGRDVVGATIEVAIFGRKVALLVLTVVVGQEAAEALASAVDGSISHAELVPVVAVDHAEDVLALGGVDGRVLVLLLVRGFHNPVTVVRNQAPSVLSRLSEVAAQRGRDTRRVERAEVVLTGSQLREGQTQGNLRSSFQGRPGGATCQPGGPRTSFLHLQATVDLRLRVLFEKP